MAAANPEKSELPEELLKHIFSFLRPPLPEVLGRARYEHIGFADEHAEAVNVYAATTQEQLLPRLKTNDEHHKVGLVTLSSSMRACKKFERIVQPLMYESYPGQPVAGLQAFNRMLIRRPDLARMVKSWKSTVAKIGFGQRLLPALLKKAEAGQQDAQVALLLFLAVDVQTLDLSAPVLLHMRWVKCLIKETAQERQNNLFRGDDEDLLPTSPATLPLRRLRSVSLHEGDTSLTVGVSVFDTLFRLPTITQLTLHRLSGQGDRLPPMPQPQELCLWRCELDAEFGQSLKACTALMTLKIIWLCISIDYLKYGMATTIDYKYLESMICKSFPTLGKLVLDTLEAFSFGNSCTLLHSLDLSSMTHLKELTVESHALWDQHVVADDRISGVVLAPLPRLQNILPPSLIKLAVLVDRHPVQPFGMLEGDDKPSRIQMLILSSCVKYLMNAPSCLRSVHLDMPFREIHDGLAGLEKLSEELGFIHGFITADPEVERASPVVGVTTPKDQRIELRTAFDVWLPDGDLSATVVFQRVTDGTSEADVEGWRDIMDEKVKEVRK